MATAEDLLVRLQQRLQAPYGSYWSESEGVYALTEALRVWQAMTGSIIETVPVLVPGGTVWLETPRQLLTISRVAARLTDGRKGPALDQYSISELDAEFGAWEDDTALMPSRWAPDGATLYALHPAPSTSVVLEIEGPVDITEFVKTGEVQGVGDEDLNRFLAYAHTPYMTFKSAPGELNTDSLTELVRAAGNKNQRLRRLDMFMRYAGMDREEALGQENTGTQGPPGLGVR